MTVAEQQGAPAGVVLWVRGPSGPLPPQAAGDSRRPQAGTAPAPSPCKCRQRPGAWLGERRTAVRRSGADREPYRRSVSDHRLGEGGCKVFGDVENGEGRCSFADGSSQRTEATRTFPRTEGRVPVHSVPAWPSRTPRATPAPHADELPSRCRSAVARMGEPRTGAYPPFATRSGCLIAVMLNPASTKWMPPVVPALKSESR